MLEVSTVHSSPSTSHLFVDAALHAARVADPLVGGIGSRLGRARCRVEKGTNCSIPFHTRRRRIAPKGLQRYDPSARTRPGGHELAAPFSWREENPFGALSEQPVWPRGRVDWPRPAVQRVPCPRSRGGHRRKAPQEGGTADPPTGTVTFLFADIEGSAHLLQQLGDRYAISWTTTEVFSALFLKRRAAGRWKLRGTSSSSPSPERKTL
jgi:hypothetical protein